MRKNISIPSLTWEMLVEVSKKCRKTPEKWLEDIVREHFKKV